MPITLRTFLICGTMLSAFAGVAWLAIATKSPVYDEPMHTAAAWQEAFNRDYRVDPEDPPLWKYVAAIPMIGRSIDGNTDSSLWGRIPQDPHLKWIWANQTLYATPGNIADDIIQRSRTMMLLLGVTLGGLIAVWAWKAGGAGGASVAGVAAISAGGLFAFDPNFIAHSPIVKNDVPLTLVMTAAVFATWLAGRKLTWLRVMAVTVLVGVGLNVKFSGVLLGPIVGALLIVRALMSDRWSVLGREIESRSRRVGVAIGLCVAIAATGYAAIWASYGFRFSPTRDPAILLDTAGQLEGEAAAEDSPNRRGKFQPNAVSDAVLWAEKHRLLPQAWLNGFLYTYLSALSRPAYLMGELSPRGWWYYFPIAMAVKTPVATLAGGLAAMAAGVALRRRSKDTSGPATESVRGFLCGWDGVCLWAPVAVYGFWSMRTGLNIGLRHMLPVYPFLFVMIGVAAGKASAVWPRAVKMIVATVLIGVAVESFAAFPNYIAFFNAPAGGSRGGLRLLGDSNLDWGQDLKLLAIWQQDHPGERLYLCYFGTADPATYEIRYTNLPGGFQFGPPTERPSAPGVIAISATSLQGIYLSPTLRDVYMPLLNRKPLAVLGGSIYLYKYP